MLVYISEVFTKMAIKATVSILALVTFGDPAQIGLFPCCVMTPKVQQVQPLHSHLHCHVCSFNKICHNP